MSNEAASELAAQRWKKTPKKERQKIASEISRARWEKWRAANPDKAKTSEERRRKRVKAKKGPG